MVYEDIREMMTSIMMYVKDNPGCVIISDDTPKDLLYGFTLRDVNPFLLTRPTWRIRARDFKSSVAKLPDKPRDILVDYFYSAYKRQFLASLLTNDKGPSDVSSSV